MRPRKPVAKIALAFIALGAVGTLTVAAQDKATALQDKYSLAVPNGLAFSEFRGYEGWQLVSISHAACLHQS